MFAISGCRSLLQSFEDSLLELMTAENSNITVGILTLSVAIPEIGLQIFPVWAAILLFPFSILGQRQSDRRTECTVTLLRTLLYLI